MPVTRLDPVREQHLLVQRRDREAGGQLPRAGEPHAAGELEHGRRAERMTPVEIEGHLVAVQLARGLAQRVGEPSAQAPLAMQQDFQPVRGPAPGAFGMHGWPMLEHHGVGRKVRRDLEDREAERALGVGLETLRQQPVEPAMVALDSKADAVAKAALESRHDLRRALVAQPIAVRLREVKVVEPLQAFVRRCLRLQAHTRPDAVSPQACARAHARLPGGFAGVRVPVDPHAGLDRPPAAERQLILHPESRLGAAQRRVDRPVGVFDPLSPRAGTEAAPELGLMDAFHPPAGADAVDLEARVDDVTGRHRVDETLAQAEVALAGRALEWRHPDREHRIAIGLAMRVARQRGRGEQARGGCPRQRHHAEAVVAAVPRDLEVPAALRWGTAPWSRGRRGRRR